MKRLIKVLFIIFMGQFCMAQQRSKCAVPEFSAHRASLVRNYSNARKSYLKDIREDKIIKVPIVVHIIHNNAKGIVGGADNNNISDQQVFSQIKTLNEDYRRKSGTRGFNDSPLGVDMRMEFELASVDPNGKPSTGINRVYSPKKSFDVFDDNYVLSDLSYWDSNKYLNVWVCTLDDDYLGFAEFPGADFDGLELEDSDEKIDGIMIDNTVFGTRIGTASTGSYSYGRTLTHEIGHWFGLIHTWGDAFCGNDFCNDTPPTERGNLSSNCNSRISNCTEKRTFNMIENYMDYTPDSCMNIFTQDQAKRVRAVVELSKRRKRFVANNSFSLPKVENLELRVLENPSVSDDLLLYLLVKEYEDVTLVLYDHVGKLIQTYTYKDTPSRVLNIPKSGLQTGVYLVKAFTDSETDVKRLILFK